jgi:hypothetical protein
VSSRRTRGGELGDGKREGGRGRSKSTGSGRGELWTRDCSNRTKRECVLARVARREVSSAVAGSLAEGWARDRERLARACIGYWWSGTRWASTGTKVVSVHRERRDGRT